MTLLGITVGYLDYFPGTKAKLIHSAASFQVMT